MIYARVKNHSFKCLKTEAPTHTLSSLVLATSSKKTQATQKATVRSGFFISTPSDNLKRRIRHSEATRCIGFTGLAQSAHSSARGNYYNSHL
jgi:hypothetical protein